MDERLSKLPPELRALWLALEGAATASMVGQHRRDTFARKWFGEQYEEIADHDRLTEFIPQYQPKTTRKKRRP